VHVSEAATPAAASLYFIVDRSHNSQLSRSKIKEVVGSMAVGYFATSKVYLLLPDGAHQCNDKLKSRGFVQQYDRDCNEKVGQFDKIVQLVKERIFYHSCEAYKKFKTCRYCGEKGKNPTCKMTLSTKEKFRL
jgi:hypothetical protein